MDFRLCRQSLLERARCVEEEACRIKNAQAQDVMRALTLLYREMSEELEHDGLFERRFLPLNVADFPGGDQLVSTGQSRNSGESDWRNSERGSREQTFQAPEDDPGRSPDLIQDEADSYRRLAF